MLTPTLTTSSHKQPQQFVCASAVIPTMPPVCCSFGEVTAGLEMLTKLEGVETFQEGIFVMPKVSTCMPTHVGTLCPVLVQRHLHV